MGDETMTRLPEMERVIDYPFTKFKSDLMDLFLIKKCRFYIGCQSGILDVAILFQRPTLIINMYTWTFGYPLFKNTRGILKNFYSKSEKRNLSLKELFEGPWNLQDINRTMSDEFETIENSSDEIEEAVLEYFSLLELQDFKLTNLQIEANESRIKTSYHLFDTVRFTLMNEEEEMTEKYRFASRIEDSKGAICQNYLKKNWN